MKKKLLAILLILALAVPSFIFAEADHNIDYSINDDRATILIEGEENKPVGITISDGDRKYYINQGITDSNGKLEFKVQLEKGKKYEILVNINGKTSSKAITIEDKDPEKPDPEKPETAYIYIKGYKGTIVDEQVEISKGETVLDLTKRVLNRKNIDYVDRSGYIASIDGQGEMDKGPESGWMYSVNGEFPDVGAGVVKVKNGDYIKWLYTMDLGKDLGHPMEGAGVSKDNPIDIAYNVVNNKSSSEEKIMEAIREAMKYFIDNIKKFKTEDIKEILRDGDKISKILLKAVKRIKTEKLLIEIGELSIKEVENLEKLINNKTEKWVIEEICTITQQNMGIVLKITNTIQDRSKPNLLIDNMLDILVRLETILAQDTLKTDRNIEKVVSIKLTGIKEDNNEITLPYILLEAADKKGIAKLVLDIDSVLVELVPDFLGENNSKQDVKIQIEKEEKKDILLIEFKLGEKTITQLNKPIKITMAYNSAIKDLDVLTMAMFTKDNSLVPIGGIYNPSNKMIKFKINKSGKYSSMESKREFKDTIGHWAEKEVGIMASKGIIDGKTKDKFDPNGNITRAEFAALVSRILKYNENLEGEMPFKDVKTNKWYYNSVLAAYENGLISGKSEDIFDPEGNITREEMAKIIGKILEDNSYKKQDEKELDKFKDKTSISNWAKEGAALSVYKEVISGDKGNFMPKSKATRAESAVMLYRLYELIMD